MGARFMSQQRPMATHPATNVGHGELAPYTSFVSGYAPYGAAYGAGPGAPNGGMYGAAAPAVPFRGGFYGYGHPGFQGHPGGHPHGYSYGGHSIMHTDRVANTEGSARQSDGRFADQEQRRNNDLLLSDNFERRLKELEEPVRDLTGVCEQRVAESRELSGMLLPASTGAARADLAQIRKTNISPQYKIRMVKDLPLSTQKKLELVHELRMAEAMDDIIREREKDLKRSLVRHVY